MEIEQSSSILYAFSTILLLPLLPVVGRSLLRSIKNYYTKPAISEIGIEERRTAIDPEWSRYSLQENLQKIGLSLTSIHHAIGDQQISVIDSLATCLIQHAANRYDGVSNLDEAWDSVISSTETKEEDWIRFRVRLEKKRQELLSLPLKNYKDFKRVVDEVFRILQEFQWFQLTTSRSIHCTLFADKWKVQLAKKCRDSPVVTECFIWYDKESGAFSGIAKWSQTFADPQVYYPALMCQLDQSLRNFFRLLLKEGELDDEKLKTRIDGYLDDLKNCGDKIEDHEALLIRWNCSDDGLMILIKELLNPNFVEDNRRDDIEKELREAFMQNLDKTSEEIQIERFESYEKARLELLEKAEEIERQRRQLIQAKEGKLFRLEQELRKAEQCDTMGTNESIFQVSCPAMLISELRNKLQKKKDKLAWARFLSLLSRSRPPYDLARLRRDHKLLRVQYEQITDFVSDVITAFDLKESFEKEGGDLSNLMSFIKRKTTVAKNEIIGILKDMVKEPMQNTTNPMWKFNGNALVLSQVLDKVKSKMPLTCEEIHVVASRVIYIDCDWVTPGIGLAISAPLVEVVGPEERTVDTSSSNAQQIKDKKARAGVGSGISGDPGSNGDAGESAGHVSILCDHLHGCKLKIKACGGDGADGQDGGDGTPGSDGKDGEDANLRPPEEVNQNFTYIPLTLLSSGILLFVSVYEMTRSVFHYFQGSEFAIKYEEKGEEGESGIAGGSGGSGGGGGKGGFPGEINIKFRLEKTAAIEEDAKNGADGKNGIPGKGAPGGKGGRNGWDAARVFTPDDLNPWFYISGNWVEDKGDLLIEDVFCKNKKKVLGCKITRRSQDKRVAADGQHGQDGNQSETSNASVPKKTMSEVDTEWTMQEQESTAALDDLEQSIRADAAALASVEAQAFAENENHAKAAAIELEANEQKLDRANEIEQRTRKEFQKAKIASPAQSMQSQLLLNADQQLPNEPETMEEAEDPYPEPVNTIQTIPITSSTEWDSLEGVSLLDALIDKFSDDAEKSQTLSMLSQSLFLRIQQQDLWTEVTNIVRHHMDHVDNLIQSLVHINQNIDLGQLFLLNKDMELLNDIQRAIQAKTLGSKLFNDANKKSVLVTIDYFQRLTWDYEELGDLLKSLESAADSSVEKDASKVRDQLVEVLGNRLVSVVASQLLPDGSSEKLLRDLFQCCRRNNPSIRVLFGTFFDNLVEALKKSDSILSDDGQDGDKSETSKAAVSPKSTLTPSDQKRTILNEFIQEKLGVLHVKDLFPSELKTISPEQLDKLAFLLNNVKTDVRDLDYVRSRVATSLEKKKTAEEKRPFEQVLLLIEKTFDQVYWSQECIKIQTMLANISVKYQQQSTDAQRLKETAMEREFFLNSVERLKVALTWTYCRKSYQQKLDIYSELRNRFRSNAWKGLVKRVLKKEREEKEGKKETEKRFDFEKTVRFFQSMEWIKKREIDIVGAFKDQGEKSDQATFMDFVKQLIVDQKKVDAKSMRPQLRRALHYLHQNKTVSFTAAEITSLNTLFEKSRFPADRDDATCQDEADLRAEYFLNWKERYFLRWTDCYAETDRLRKEIRSNWIEICADLDSVLEPTKVVHRMDVLLNRYNILASLCLSPAECNKQWRSLSEEPHENLEQCIKTRMKQNFSHVIQQLMADVVKEINELSATSKPGKTNQTQPGSEMYLSDEALDSLVTVVEQCKGPEKEKRLSSLLPNVELLILCQVGLDDSNPTRTSNLVSQLEEWKKSISRMTLNGKQNEICKSLSKILDLVFWSVTGDELLIEQLILKDRQNRLDVKRAIVSLESFLDHLVKANEIETLDIFKATVQFLKDGEDFSPWRLSFNQNQDQLLLVDKQIDIWNHCVKEGKLHPAKSVAEFLEALLTSSSPSMLKLRLTIAAQLLDHYIKPCEDLVLLERWSGLIATISTWPQVQTDQDICNRLLSVQTSLILHLTAFLRRRLQQKKVKKSIEFQFKELINQLGMVANFLERSEAQANLLIFDGLVHLVKAIDVIVDNLNPSHFVSEYIEQLYNGNKKGVNKNYDLRKKAICQVLYSDSSKDQEKEPVFTPLEKAYVERWLQTKSCFQSEDHIRHFFGQIDAVNKSTLINQTEAVKTQENRLFSSTDFDLMFTSEEKNYIGIVGRDVAEELLRTQQPLSYMHVLKERAVQKIYLGFLRYFYPELDPEQKDLLLNAKPIVPTDPNDKRKCIVEFRQAFSRAHFFAKREGVEFEWLIWLQETVLRSIVSTRDQVGLALVTEILSTSIEFTPEQLFSWTTKSRPHRWLDDALVNSIMNVMDQFHRKASATNAGSDELKTDLQSCLKIHQHDGRAVLKIFLRKLEHESRVNPATSNPIDLSFLTGIVADLKVLQRIDDIGRFRETPLRKWARLIQHARLADAWPSSLTDQLTTILDRRLGHDKTDRFLHRFHSKYGLSEKASVSSGPNPEKILQDMLKNLSKYPWIVDKFFTLANEENVSNDNLWKFIQNRELIEKEKKADSKADLDPKQLTDMMKNDEGSCAIVGSLQQKLIGQVKEIRRLALEERKSWDDKKIKEWTENRKKVSEFKRQLLDPVDFLSVAFRAVKLKEKYGLRDAQLLAVLIFISSSTAEDGPQLRRRMAQISTGEGKTLITALLVVYHVLENWSNGRRFVDIITSSSVLAEANVTDIKWFFDLFGISVTNNCDADCSEDENKRRLRYNSDVIYGDLSSFQRDILLSNFFSERKITNGRIASAVVVDEVDSMLLDKGENILYLSHKIPEMDDLTQVFAEIWNAVHAPDVAMSDESAQAKVYRFIKLRLEEGDIVIPKCLETYVHRHLLAWTRNAFRAKNLVTTKDSYKVDDVGDGHGQQIVIMDKETGVEQVQMHWSQGLHQFLQLKHTLKLSPVSLKAVFMSNIGFFEECKDDGRRTALYGMTGTLGSTAECQLLHDVFNVDFFKMPRHKRRFCIEEDPLLASSKDKWLENISNATQTQLDKGRAVLIVCENIAAAEEIHKELSVKQSNDKKKVSTIDMYISSFDKEFQKKQHDSALGPGDVIVATNLAGRGTDLKINDELAENGGLHVVIGYVPANARVEAQIEGRVARAGQPGSYQFVVCHPSVNSRKEPISELLRLKVHRDDKECRRLATIRTRGLQKINLEGKLFDRFRKEIYNEIKKEWDKRPDCKLQMEFLTNRWALWLDENAEHINNVHLKKTDEIDKNFQKFKEELCHHPTTPLAFALTPSELMKLGEFYETCQETDLEKSSQCYSKVIEDEPNACEAALIRKAKLILQKAIELDKKKEAKVLLKRAKNLIKIKMELLTSTSELVKLTSKCNQRAGGAVPSHNRFEEQIINQLSLLQIHLSAVEDILGRPVRQMLEVQFPKDAREEISELLDVIEAGAGLCKPYRLSKNISFESKDGNEIIRLTSHQVQKTVAWPSHLDHCLTQTVQLIKEKIMKESLTIEKKELESVIVTQDQLWQTLLEEGFVSQEEIIRQQKLCWADQKMESVKTFLNDLPKELIHYKSLLVNWLENHSDEDFATAEGKLGLDPENSPILVKFLKTKKVLLCVEERHGKVAKTFDFKSHLPENLRKHHRLLSDWSLDNRETTAAAQIGQAVSREDLPCPKDSMEAVDQLWNHLVEQGVIKESKIIFTRGLESEESQKRISEIETAVKTSLSASIDVICRKYRTAPEPTTELSRADIQEYLEHDKNEITESTPITVEPGRIKKWIAKRKMKKHLESYRDEVFETLKKSIGHLHTIPRVTASFQPMSKHFTSDLNPKRFPAEEIQSLQDKTFDQVIILEEDKLWRDYFSWRAFFVASFAFAKISTGLVVQVMSDEMINLDELKIPGSFGEMMFAIQNSLSGMSASNVFSSHMLLSVGLTIATGGLSSYLTKGAAVLKTVLSGFQGKTGLSSCFAVAKAALAKYGKPVLSALTSFGVDKFLTWLKTYIMDKMTSLVKSLISKMLSPMFETLVKKLEQIRGLMTKKGLELAQIMASIRATLKKVGTSELTKLWVRRAVDQATSLANSMVGGFAKTLGDVSNALKTSFKFDGFVEKAKNVLKYLEKSAEIVRLVSQAPEYVESINQTLDTMIINKLESGIEIEVDTSSEKATEKNFDEFKKNVKNQIEDNIFQSLIESLKKAWFAPWLQGKIENMVDHYSKKTLQVASFVWQGSDDAAAEAPGDSADEGNTEDPPTAIDAGEEEAEKLKDLLGDEGCEIQKDRQGNAVVEPKTFEQVVHSIGGGESVGLLQIQMIANAVHYSLEIVDKVGELVKDGSGSFVPEGKSKGNIKVIYTENEEDGTKRVTVEGLDDQPIDLSTADDGKPASLGGCLYDAVAKALGSSTDELLAQVKTHAINSKTARYWYEDMVGEAFPGLGNRAKEESSTPDFRPDEKSPSNGVYSVVQRLILGTIKEHLTLDAR